MLAKAQRPTGQHDFVSAAIPGAFGCMQAISGPSRSSKVQEPGMKKFLGLEERIGIIRDNIRQLVEQAASFSGAEDEARNADRIAQQTEELERLVKQRDALLKN
jgi:hypothetical protein